MSGTTWPWLMNPLNGVTDCLLQAARVLTCDALPLPLPARYAPRDAPPPVAVGEATRALPGLLKLARSRQGWEEGGTHGGVACRTRTAIGSPFLMVLGQRHIRASAVRLAQLAAGVENLPPLDPDTVSVRTLRPPTAQAEGVYTSEIRLPWPFSNRQVVWTEAVDLAVDGGPTAAVVMVSTAHAQQGAPAGTVLAEMHLGGFVFEPDGDGCLCSFVCHFDPKGSIPAAAANLAVGDHVAILDVLAEAVRLQGA